MKLSKRNALFTLVAAVLLGWGIFYTNCGTQQDALNEDGIDGSGAAKPLSTQAYLVCHPTAAGPATGTNLNQGYGCQISFACNNGTTTCVGGSYYPLNGNGTGMCCLPGWVDCTATGVAMQSDGGGSLSTTSPSSTSPTTTKTK